MQFDLFLLIKLNILLRQQICFLAPVFNPKNRLCTPKKTFYLTFLPPNIWFLRKTTTKKVQKTKFTPKKASNIPQKVLSESYFRLSLTSLVIDMPRILGIGPVVKDLS